MCKKNLEKALVTLLFCVFSSALFAYNPPFGGEDMFRLTSPELLAGGASATGGPFFCVTPLSVAFNPALSALEQRVLLTANGSLLIDSDSSDGDGSWGGGFGAGLIIPSKWFVFTGALEGLFCQNDALYVGNSFTSRLGLSKEVTEKLFVGATVYTGFFVLHDTDFTVGADIGMLYKIEDFAFFKNPRLGISLLNMGKPLTSYSVLGIYGTREGTSYPGIFTPRVSFSSIIFETSRIAGGFSVDMSAPSFQNAVFDLACGVQLRQKISILCSWQVNCRELYEGATPNLPCLGVSARLTISSKSARVKESWQKSELEPALAWQSLYGTIQDISAGVHLYLGMEDKEAPTIILWNEE